MTLPKPVYPGDTVLATRRCNERRFRLRPDPVIEQIVLYCLAVAAAKYRIEVHAFCVMSNHVHKDYFDPEGNGTKFRCWFNAMVARAVNAYLGRRGYFWEPPPDSRVKALDEETLLTQVVYTLANPVLSGAVRSARSWPGLWSDPQRVEGKPYRVERPKIFFAQGEESACPAVAYLQLRKPREFSHLSVEKYRELLERKLAEKEEETRVEFARVGRRFRGRSRVMKESRGRCGRQSEEEKDRYKMFAGPRALVREAKEAYREFVRAYRVALETFRAGKRDVRFPWGTDAYRNRLGVLCSGPPPPEG